MSLTIEIPESLEVAIRTKALDSGLSAEEYALQILDRDLRAAEPPPRHISDLICDIMSDVPSEFFQQIPPDGSSEHDHYLYGSNKKGS